MCWLKWELRIISVLTPGCKEQRRRTNHLLETNMREVDAHAEYKTLAHKLESKQTVINWLYICFVQLEIGKIPFLKKLILTNDAPLLPYNSLEIMLELHQVVAPVRPSMHPYLVKEKLKVLLQMQAEGCSK